MGDADGHLTGDVPDVSTGSDVSESTETGSSCDLNEPRAFPDGLVGSLPSWGSFFLIRERGEPTRRRGDARA